MTEQRYAGGGIVRELLEGVAKEAPELTRGVRAATRRATINVGLDINGGEKLSPDEVLAALQSFGVKPVRAAVHQSDTEPTLVIELDRSLNSQEAHKLSMDLRQEAIAQVDENGVGDLHGPAADNWKPFNGDYFLDADGKRLTQAIMDAGEGEKPGYAGGGLVDDAARWLEQFVRRDNPASRGNIEWLKDQQARAMRDPRALRGATTAWTTDNSLEIPTELLAKLKGAEGENRVPGDWQYDTLLKDVQEQGWQPTPILIRVNHHGEPYIMEGNTRTAVAKALGIPSVPAEVRWINGGEMVDGDWSPERLAEYLHANKGKPGYAGGGIIREAVEGLIKAAGRNADEAADLAKPMRLYHGTEAVDTIGALDPFVSHDQLGVHLGDPATASQFARVGDHVQHWKNRRPDEAGARVIPLDVDMKNPLRLMDNKGSWAPHEVYKQMADRGLVPWDEDKFKSLKYRSEGWVQDEDGSWGDYGDQMSMLDAQSEIQDMIRDLGHDGVVYLNRYEFPHPSVKSRAEGKPRSYLNSMTDEQFRAEFPEAVDSYIAFRKDQLKSPFGDGPGVGFAGGGVVRKLGQGLVDMLDFSGVGKPRTVKIPGVGEHAALPIGEIDDAAEAYMRKAGIPGTHRINEYPELDPDFSRRIADQYDVLTHAPNDPEVARTYEALLEETMDQYRALKDTGLDIRFLKDGMDDPYALSPSMGYADMVNNGRLWVFPTSQGYGSGADVLEHPLLKKVGKVGDLEDATANDAFRVVHDAYGHFGPGNPFFRAAGEDRAWMHHARMYSDDALPAMSAETRGQNSWVNFGPKARENKGASGASTIYADQKAVAMPRWVYEKDLGRIPKYADGGPVWSEEDIASMTHDHSYGTGREMNYLETLGTEIPLGEMNFYDVDGERRMPEGIQGLHDGARLGIYAVPGAGPFIGAGLDTAEAIAEDDPLSAGMAVAFGPGGKLAKGAMTGAMAVGMDPAEAEAGMFGLLGKWGASKEGKAMLQKAEDMAYNKASDEEIVKATGWTFDKDGQPKYELPSIGGSADLSKLRHGLLKEVYYDPNLFDQYPGIENTRVRRIRDLEGAYYSPSEGYIGVGDISSPFYQTYDVGGAKGVLDHELYHLKAQMERWAQGTNKRQAHVDVINDMKNYLKLKDAESQNIGGYINNLKPEQQTGLGGLRYVTDIGEVLARREARRRDFMDADILAKPAPSDLDVPSDAIFYKGYNRPNTYANAIEWNNKLRREGKGLP